MDTNKRPAVAVMLAAVGGLEIVLSMILDWTSLARPRSPLVGFAFGLSAGLGTAAGNLWALQEAKRNVGTVRQAGMDDESETHDFILGSIPDVVKFLAVGGGACQAGVLG